MDDALKKRVSVAGRSLSKVLRRDRQEGMGRGGSDCSLPYKVVFMPCDKYTVREEERPLIRGVPPIGGCVYFRLTVGPAAGRVGDELGAVGFHTRSFHTGFFFFFYGKSQGT